MSKKIIAFVILVLIIVGIYLFNKNKKEPVSSLLDLNSLCFYRSVQTPGGFFDRYWVKMELDDEANVTGEFYSIPAEKDSKTGAFTGVIENWNKDSASGIANLWWQASGEGVINTEELLVDFGEGSAVALYGEMSDRGDGVYVYKDKTKLTPGPVLWQIDCLELDELTAVEKHVRENIKEIATNEEVLGGSWYVISVDLNITENTGVVVYEDGHVQSTANFSYAFNTADKSVNITNFVVID